MTPAQAMEEWTLSVVVTVIDYVQYCLGSQRLPLHACRL